ncbi:hypothetical protein D3C85_1492620 [compost metagenome]
MDKECQIHEKNQEVKGQCEQAWKFLKVKGTHTEYTKLAEHPVQQAVAVDQRWQG